MMDFLIGLVVGALLGNIVTRVAYYMDSRSTNGSVELPPAESNGKPRRRNMHD